MDRQLSVIFEAPYAIAVKEAPVPEPAEGQVLVKTMLSAISPGTEMLFYRGQVPEAMPVDATIEALAGDFSYPLGYGYALVGKVTAVGAQRDRDWLDRLVFVFAPHQSHVVSKVENLIPVPVGLSPENAVLLPFMETAVSFLMDGQPMIGEQVVIFGQGIIGLLVTMLLAGYPLANLVTVDPFALRRDYSLRLGANHALDPLSDDSAQKLVSALQGDRNYRGADLLFELSGNPKALDQAIACTGFDGRLLVGSWYGRKKAPIDLGGHFHRNQIKLISSQVSRIAPRWRGRFDNSRRLRFSWTMLDRHRPESLITHRFPISEAALAYQLLDEMPHTAVQLILDYDE